MHAAAVSVGLWSNTTDFVETGYSGGTDGLKMQAVLPGSSIGRDENSTDTNSVLDWAGLGGISSIQTTPALANIDPFFLFVTQGFPLFPNAKQPKSKKKKKDLTVMSFLVNQYDDKGFYPNPTPSADLASDTARAMQEILVTVNPKRVNFVAQYGKSRFHFAVNGAIRSGVKSWRPGKLFV